MKTSNEAIRLESEIISLVHGNKNLFSPEYYERAMNIADKYTLSNNVDALVCFRDLMKTEISKASN